MNYDAVVFDNDGVLVRRTRYDRLHEAAWNAFEAVDVPDPDPVDVESMVVGVSPADVHAVADTYGLDAGAFWAARDRTAAAVQREEVQAGRKHLYEDVPTLRDLRPSLGVVSSNQQATVDFALEHLGVSDLFGTAYGREPTVESLRRKKPAPHYLERALADLDAETALFVGDNENDCRAADNAGVDSAFLRRPHRADHDLAVEPTYELDSLHDLHSICR